MKTVAIQACMSLLIREKKKKKPKTTAVSKAITFNLCKKD